MQKMSVISVTCLVALAFSALINARPAHADTCYGVCQLQRPTSAVPGSHIAVLSRTTSHEEMFYVAPDGSVQDTYTYGGGTWNTFQLAPKGSAATCAGYNITAVSRASNTMEVFWIGADRSVHDSAYYDGVGWSGLGRNPALPLIAPAYTTPPYDYGLIPYCRGGVASASRSPDRLEVVWVDQNLTVQDASWQQGYSWVYHRPLTGQSAVSMWTGSTVALASRTPNTEDLWFLSNDYSVCHAGFVDGSDWSAPACGNTGLGSLTAISRAPNTVELFWLNWDGSIDDSWWYTNNDQGSATRTGLAVGIPSYNYYYYGFPPFGPSVAAVAPEPRTGKSMMVFFTSADGSIDVLEWYQGAGPWRRWQVAPPGSNTAASIYNDSIAVVHAAADDTIDVFWINADGSIQHAYW